MCTHAHLSGFHSLAKNVVHMPKTRPCRANNYSDMFTVFTLNTSITMDPVGWTYPAAEQTISFTLIASAAKNPVLKASRLCASSGLHKHSQRAQNISILQSPSMPLPVPFRTDEPLCPVSPVSSPLPATEISLEEVKVRGATKEPHGHPTPRLLVPSWSLVCLSVCLFVSLASLELTV